MANTVGLSIRRRGAFGIESVYGVRHGLVDLSGRLARPAFREGLAVWLVRVMHRHRGPAPVGQ